MKHSRMVLVGFVLGGLVCGSLAWAQSSRRTAPPSTKLLDQEAEKAESAYLNSLADLASKYEEAGDVARSSEMLKAILKLKPDAELVKNKLKQLEEAVFQENVHKLEIEAGAGWVPAGVLVGKGRPIRIEADGVYRITLSDSLGPDGFPNSDPLRDMAEGIPAGGLMAMVGKTPGTPQPRGNRQGNDQSPKIVYIGTQSEFSPPEGGPLYLRINVPRTANCTGRVKVQISGNFAISR